MSDTRLWDGSAADNSFATAANWSGAAVPITGDSAVLPAMAAASGLDIAGSDQSAILLVNFTAEPGCYVNIGSRLTPLHLDADYFTFEGSGSAWVDLDNSTRAEIFNALSTASDGGYGLNITGDANALLLIDAGSSARVGVAAYATNVAAFTTIQIASGYVFLGAGVKQANGSDPITTLHHAGGTTENSSAVVTVNLAGGTYTQLLGAVTNLNLRGGRYHWGSTDTITAATLYGGVLDLSRDTRAKTATSLTIHPGATIYDPGNVLTVTNGITRAKGGTLSLA